MDIINWSPAFWIKNESDCLDYLEKHWNAIPLLNVNDIQNLRNNKLVRFRGMIQDMYNPEYYFEKFEVINEVTKDSYIKNGKYLDMTDCRENEIIDYESKSNVTGDRQTLVVISVPGLNTWVENYEVQEFKIDFIKSSPSGSQTTHNKRKLEDANTEDKIEINLEPIVKEDIKTTEDMETETVEPQTATSSNSDDPNKKLCVKTETPNNNAPIISTEYLLNFPLEGRTGKACHLKIYEQSDKLKLNDLCEFVGFLSVDPLLASNYPKDEDNFDGEMEYQIHNPSPSLIPRIHCVSWRYLKHNNPLLQELDMSVEKMEDVKKELMIILTQILLGDELAAEYLLYHLISEVYSRHELMALGKLALNISGIPIGRIEEYGEKFYEFIEMLMPKSHYLPMTLSNMNSLTFTPKKDYQCNRLTSGLLQLSNNTHLVVDETKLSAGKLNEQGVKGVQAISNVIKNQKLSYDFQYYPMEYNCDIPILILSEGKSLLPSDCHVPLKPAEICINEFEQLITSTKTYLIPERLNDIRRYLTHARFGKYEFSDNVQELVQKEFVDLRQKEKISPDDLHQLLIIARFVCLSEGKPKLNDECWRRACNLESRRKERLAKK